MAVGLGYQDKTEVVGMLDGLDQVHKRKEVFNGRRMDNRRYKKSRLQMFEAHPNPAQHDVVEGEDGLPCHVQELGHFMYL